MLGPLKILTMSLVVRLERCFEIETQEYSQPELSTFSKLLYANDRIMDYAITIDHRDRCLPTTNHGAILFMKFHTTTSTIL